MKHYLNEAGIKYFDTKWYPYVANRIQRQNGYIAIEVIADQNPEYRNITVKFQTQATLDAWVAHIED